MKLTHKDIVMLIGIIVALAITIYFSHFEFNQPKHRVSKSQVIHVLSARTSFQKSIQLMKLKSILDFISHR